MRKYECAVIYAPTVSGETLQERGQRYTDVIKSEGGSFTELDDWGKRTLAYEIDHHREGFYHFYRFEGTSRTVDELNRQLRIDENVIRHMIVRDEVEAQREEATEAEGTPAVEASPASQEEGDAS